jgi:hypothetical protein
MNELTFAKNSCTILSILILLLLQEEVVTALRDRN